MENFKLCDSDYRFMTIVWENAPIASGELVKLCNENLGWKKSTTYTAIKKLSEKGYIKNISDLPKDKRVEIYRKIATLQSVGLGYITLGQNALTLSGGEAQRVKLANELARPATSKTLYILDEPTTGLHFADVKQLMTVIQCLVDQGNSVVMIEHNLDVICQSDYIIDLGPEGGFRGGTIVTTGTPEQVAECKESYTGQFIKPMLESWK